MSKSALADIFPKIFDDLGLTPTQGSTVEPMSISYECVALAGITEPAQLEKDKDGYYRVMLGALNVFNSGGIYYVFEDSKKAFESSGIFMRKALSGKLFGERDHPPYEPGMSEAAWVDRNEWLEISNESHRIRSITLITTDEQCNGFPVVEIWGWVKPSGEHAAKLQAALDDPHQNVCFSLRAIVKERTLPNGQRHRMIDEMFTFDWVCEDGLAICNKYSSIVRSAKVAQESVRTFASVKMTERICEEVIRNSTVTRKGRIGQESHRVAVHQRAHEMLRGLRVRPKVQAHGITATGW